MTPDDLKAKLVRGTVLVLTLLGLLALVLSFVPSVDVFKDTSDCHNFGGLFVMEHREHHTEACSEVWTLVQTRTPVAHHLGMTLYYLVLLAPGLLVWWKPRLKLVLLWSLAALGATFVMIVATFELFGDWGFRTVERWPAEVFGYASAALVLALIVALPVSCLVFGLATRKRPPPEREFASARIHRG